MEEVRKKDTESKEDWEAPALTVLDVEAGTEGTFSGSGVDFGTYS